MSRKNAKLALLHDLQCKQSDCILTKKDLDLICEGLLNTYKFSGIKDLYYIFKNISTQL